MDDEDENPTLEAYFINSSMFSMIKAVPEELQVRKLLVMANDDGDGGDDDDED